MQLRFGPTVLFSDVYIHIYYRQTGFIDSAISFSYTDSNIV